MGLSGRDDDVVWEYPRKEQKPDKKDEEIARLRKALKQIIKKDQQVRNYWSTISQATGDRHLRTEWVDGPSAKIARAALGEET